MQPDDSDRIEDLKHSLYSRNAPEVRTRRKLRLFDRVTDVKNDWGRKEEAIETEGGYGEQERSKHMSFPTKLFIASAIFCILAVGVGAYVFWNGGNLISANNIAIDVTGPVSISGGTPISLNIVVTNRNSVILKDANLKVSFPAGTTNPDDTTQSMESHEEVLGDLAPGASVTKVVRAIIFGEENLQKEVRSTVTYGIADSSSVFTKEQTYEVLINSSPVSLTASTFKQVASGIPFDLTIDVKSNSENVMKNVLLKAAYPLGYSFQSATINPLTSDNATWLIGDMPPGSKRTIVIHGALTGEDSELRVFRFNIGAQSAANPTAIGTAFVSAEADVNIEKSFLSLTIVPDNARGTNDYAGRFGRSTNVVVNWANNLPESLSNVTITAHLSGSAYDKQQVTSLDGYFRSATDDVVWSRQTNPELATVAAGASGSFSFAIVPIDKSSGSGRVVNPVITVEASATGNRSAEANVPQSTTKITRDLKISSNISLSGRIMRNGGTFINSGPIPPKADQPTTYTVVWTVDNTSSAVSNASVTATLPPYVSWIGQFNPQSENVVYDSNSSTVTWNIGSLNTYTFGTTNRREVQFQISLLPSVNQIGQAPTLIGRASLSAVDNFTKANLQSTQDYLTTSFSTDPSYVKGNETVVK